MAHLVPVPRYVRKRDGDRDRDRAVRLPNGRGLGIGEHDPGYGGVVRFPRLAEDVEATTRPLVFPDVGEWPDSGDVADRPPPDTHVHLRVDGELLVTA